MHRNRRCYYYDYSSLAKYCMHVCYVDVQMHDSLAGLSTRRLAGKILASMLGRLFHYELDIQMH